MSYRIWMVCPTIQPAKASETFGKWRRAGYCTAALIDGDCPEPENCDAYLRIEAYRGYSDAINRLWFAVVDQCDILIPGGDDLMPCMERSCDDLAADFFGRFSNGFGVMHLAKFDLSKGASTDHPWMGAAYCRRINGGTGPYWPEYWHYFNDTEAGLVAERLRVLWRRPELGQYHDHWTVNGGTRPAHLEKAGRMLEEMKRLFCKRRQAEFPGHEPRP